MVAEETDWAWLAGLYEGEGCLASHRPYQRGGDVVAWSLVITMADRDVVRRARLIAGVGPPVRPSRQPGPQTYWRWNVCACGELAVLLPRLLPYLGRRRARRVRECLAWLATRGY